MLNIIIGFILGTLTATFGINKTLETEKRLSQEHLEIIDDLMKENAAYKKVVKNWKAESDKINADYWG